MYPDQNQGEQPNYDFIMNSDQRPKRSFIYPGSKMGRIAVMGGLGLVIVIIIAVFGSIISSASGQGGKDLTDLIAYQNELGRVLSLGNDKTRDGNLRVKAVTASYTLRTHYQASAGLIKNRGIKVDKKAIAKYKGSANDAVLAQADTSNTYDTVYLALYTEKLEAYKTKLAAIYPNLSAKEKARVKLMSDDTNTLLL